MLSVATDSVPWQCCMLRLVRCMLSAAALPVGSHNILSPVLSVGCCPLHVVHCLLQRCRCLWRGVRCRLSVACCPLHVPCCRLHVACRPLWSVATPPVATVATVPTPTSHGTSRPVHAARCVLAFRRLSRVSSVVCHLLSVAILSSCVLHVACAQGCAFSSGCGAWRP